MTRPTLLCLWISVFAFPAISQSGPIVDWNFKWKPVSANEVLLLIEAQLNSGCHLFSQFIEDGGPLPTRFIFLKSDDYKLIGQPLESGDPIFRYDNIYKMNITSYSGNVNFLQRVQVKNPLTYLKGTIEYMACNDNQCIPEERFFSVVIDLKHKTP
jgi:thiol:disulfide interchange protein DsbD